MKCSVTLCKKRYIIRKIIPGKFLNGLKATETPQFLLIQMCCNQYFFLFLRAFITASRVKINLFGKQRTQSVFLNHLEEFLNVLYVPYKTYCCHFIGVGKIWENNNSSWLVTDSSISVYLFCRNQAFAISVFMSGVLVTSNFTQLVRVYALNQWLWISWLSRLLEGGDFNLGLYLVPPTVGSLSTTSLSLWMSWFGWRW